MIPPVPYKGEKPYIFISYAHKDADRVWPIVARLQMDGYRVWYDEGIDPGTEWDENIASHVSGCGYFLAFISASYLQSNNCRDELNFARDLEKKQVLIYLEDVTLPQGIALRFGRFQNFRADRPGFFGRLYEAEGIKAFTTGKKIRSKKWLIPVCLAVVLAIAAALVLPGLFSKEESQPEVTGPAQTEPAAETTEEPFTFRNTTFFRSNTGIKLTAQELYFNEDGNLVLDTLLENTTDCEMTLAITSTYLNGIRCQSNVLSEIPANANESMQIFWKADELAASGLGNIRDVTEITTIEGSYHLVQEDRGSEIEYFLYYPYGEGNAVPFSYTPDSDDILVVDEANYQLIFTGHFIDESGAWVGEFVHKNLSDRHLSATFAVEQTNGYVYGNHNVEVIRAGQAVCNRLVLADWQVTQQDTVRRIDGYYHLWDSAANAWLGEQIPVCIFPEADTDITFPLRTLDADDKILVENDHIRLALIEDYPESDERYTWRVYCVNLSDKTVRVQLTNVKENGQDGYDWYIGTLAPGQQCFATKSNYHDAEENKEVLTGELVVSDDSYYYDEEYSRDDLCLEFSW